MANSVLGFLYDFADAVQDIRNKLEESDEDEGVLEEVRMEIQTDDLKDVLKHKGDHHAQKAENYAERAEMLRQDEAEQEQHVSGSPLQQQERKAREHRRKAGKFYFMAEHLQEGKTYRFGRNKLESLGLVDYYVSENFGKDI